jgi:hypothetical protein
MTPDDLWIEMERFDGAHADRVWDGSAATEDAPAWYGRVATLLRAAPAPATAEELTGESEIVARMQAAILEPATDDDLAGESDIVSRMQATILDLALPADGDDAGDTHRPRHLRAAPSAPGARRRQGIRLVRRMVAVKATAITTVVAIGVTAAAATTGIVATVVMPALSDRPPKVTVETASSPSPADGESSTGGSGDTDRGASEGTGDEPVVAMDPDEPLVCMLDMDCLLHEVDVAAAAPSAALPSTTPSTTEAPPATPSTTEAQPATPSTTEAQPATTTTTAPPPPTTTTTAPPPPTTTTTAPPPPPPPPPAEKAAPAPAETMSAPTGDAGSATGVTLAAAGGTGSEPSPTG